MYLPSQTEEQSGAESGAVRPVLLSPVPTSRLIEQLHVSRLFLPFPICFVSITSSAFNSDLDRRYVMSLFSGFWTARARMRGGENSPLLLTVLPLLPLQASCMFSCARASHPYFPPPACTLPCVWLPLPLTSCSQPADRPASPRLMNCSPTFSQTLGRPSPSRPEQVSG
jgi:hypothetical protein